MMNSAPSDNRVFQSQPVIEDEEIDIGSLIGVLIESRWQILAITVVALCIGLFKAFTAVSIYQADGLLQVEEKTSGLTNLEATTMLGDYAPINAEIEILRSRSVLGKVVDNLQLDISVAPEYFPIIGAALARRAPASERPTITVDTFDVPDSLRGQTTVLVSDGGDGYALFDSSESLLVRGRVGEVAIVDLPGDAKMTLFVSAINANDGQKFTIRRGSKLVSTRSLQARMSVAEQGDWSGILAISVSGPDPESITNQVNEIANVYVRQNVERKSAEAAKTLEFLDGQLPIVRQNVEAAELALNNYRLEKGSIDLPAETQGVLQSIVAVEAQINQLRQEREKIRLAFTEIHPTIVAVDRQIRRLEDELSNLNEQVRDLPTTQQDLLRLIRDVEVNTTLYTSLLDTAQELRVVKAGTIGNVRVIDYAYVPPSPVKPSRPRIVMVAVLLGLFAGIAVAFVKRALRSGVEDPDLVERHVNIPIYATISHSERQDEIYKQMKNNEAGRAILAVDTPDDPAIESIRNLLTALHFGMMDVKNNCIMIAGPSPEVGKSFVSVNLAAVLTSADKKVLLVDADLRRGHLNKYLGLERDNGLSEFISGEVPIGDVLHETSVPGLTLIPTGALPPNPTELLLHQRFGNCMNVLSSRFDHIIIDSPPILAAADAAIIGQMAGGTLMVLKSGVHEMREIEISVKRLRQAEVNLRGILFNDIVAHGRRYGAGRYNYQYSYQSGSDSK